MIGKRITLFKLLGFDVQVDLSWVFIAWLIVWTLARDYFPYKFHNLSNSSYWIMGIGGALGLFISIVLHELGHSLVARRDGIAIKGITLFIFGGVAEMEGEPPNPQSEFRMAIAGPIVSILIAIVCYPLYIFGRRFGWPVELTRVLFYLSWINVLLVVFNLVTEAGSGRYGTVIRANAAQQADVGSSCVRPHLPEYTDEDQIAPARAPGLISSESGKRNECIGHAIFQTLEGMALLTTLTCCGAIWAQVPPVPPASPQQETVKNVKAPCVEPLPMLRWEVYQGPFKKIVGTFARKLELKAVHPPHYKPRAVLCMLEPKEKLSLFVQDTFDPVTFLYAGFNAGLGQAGDEVPTFGQGAEGFGKRFGAHFVDQASSDFFKDFAYPSIFSEDPRYYRLAQGSGGRRLLHAAGHAFLAHRENGTRMFNFSEWLGTTSAVALSNLYHPGNERGVAPAARRVVYSVLEDMGFDVLREFWPEIARKLRLPFRDKLESEPQDSGHDAK